MVLCELDCASILVRSHAYQPYLVKYRDSPRVKQMKDIEENLDVKLVDQDDLESSITKRANEALINRETELDEKRLQKSTSDLEKTLKRISLLQKRLDNPRTKLSQRKLLKDEIQWLNKNELIPRQQDVADIRARLQGNKELLQEKDTGGSGQRQAGESERDFLIRTGKITAFGNSTSFATDDQTNRSHQHLRAPGFEEVGKRQSIAEHRENLLVKSNDEADGPLRKRAKKDLLESEYEDQDDSEADYIGS